MTLTDYHAFKDSVRWRLTANGVDIEGSGVERSAGAPVTARRVWKHHAEAINRVARRWQVPCALIVATVCTESAARPDAVRKEPGYTSDEETPHKISAGLMQTLISTARDTLRISLDRAWLLEPENSLNAGTGYIAQQSNITGLDPPLVAAAYNAGKLAHQTGAQNRWKLRQFPIGTGKHCDRFVRFFNDTLVVFAESATKPAVGIDELLAGRSLRCRQLAPTD
jgi:Transglycosylase SLT domain